MAPQIDFLAGPKPAGGVRRRSQVRFWALSLVVTLVAAVMVVLPVSAASAAVTCLSNTEFGYNVTSIGIDAQLKDPTTNGGSLQDAAAVYAEAARQMNQLPVCNHEQLRYRQAWLNYMFAQLGWDSCYPLYTQAGSEGGVAAWLDCVEPWTIALTTEYGLRAEALSDLAVNDPPLDPDYPQPAGSGSDDPPTEYTMAALALELLTDYATTQVQAAPNRGQAQKALQQLGKGLVALLEKKPLPPALKEEIKISVIDLARPEARKELENITGTLQDNLVDWVLTRGHEHGAATALANDQVKSSGSITLQIRVNLTPTDGTADQSSVGVVTIPVAR